MVKKASRWQDVKKTDIPLERLIKTYELDCHASHSPQTYQWYTKRLTAFRKWLEQDGPGTLEDFTRESARAFIAYLQDKDRRYENHPNKEVLEGGLSSHTIAGYARALKCFARWLAEEKYTDENVLDGFTIPKTVKQSKDVLSEEEIERLFSCLDSNTALGSREHAILWTFLDCGLRCSELINLKMQDAHVEQGYLKVLGKGKKERLVPIGIATQKALLRYREHFRPFFAKLPVDNFFLSVDSTPMTVFSINRMLKRLGKKAEVPRIHPHLLRHTFATNYLVYQCGDPLRLQQVLGHTSLEMVRHYAEAASIHRNILERRSSPMDIFAANHISRRPRKSAKGGVG